MTMNPHSMSVISLASLAESCHDMMNQANNNNINNNNDHNYINNSNSNHSSCDFLTTANATDPMSAGAMCDDNDAAGMTGFEGCYDNEQTAMHQQQQIKTEEDIIVVKQEAEEEEGLCAANSTPAAPWTTTFMDKRFATEDSSHFKITIHSKGDEEVEQLPENMYSSIKYHLCHMVSGSFLKTHKLDQLVVRVRVVDPDTLEEIKQNHKSIVKGVVESACVYPQPHTKSNSRKSGLARQNSNSTHLQLDQASTQHLYTSMKIQLTSCSYHHARAKFAIMCSYYRSEDLEQPIVQKVSTPFLCFARKPQLKKNDDFGLSSTTTNNHNTSDRSMMNGGKNSGGGGGQLTGTKRKHSQQFAHMPNISDNSDFNSEDDITTEVSSDVAANSPLSVSSNSDYEPDAKRARIMAQLDTEYPTHSREFKEFVRKLEGLFDSFPRGDDNERTEASSLIVRKLMQLVDSDNQTYLDGYVSTTSTAPTTTDNNNMNNHNSISAMGQHQSPPAHIACPIATSAGSTTTHSRNSPVAINAPAATEPLASKMVSNNHPSAIAAAAAAIAAAATAIHAPPPPLPPQQSPMDSATLPNSASYSNLLNLADQSLVSPFDITAALVSDEYHTDDDSGVTNSMIYPYGTAFGIGDI